MLDDSVIARAPALYQPTSNVDTAVYIGRNKTGNSYKGYIDEMRVWNAALTDSVISRNRTRLLTGGEKGLVAYWRFDETIPTLFFDLSHNGVNYNRNDGKINGNSPRSSLNVPSPDQLSFKDYTDSTGNYFIAGIPYTGNGTTYAIVPLLGTHQFDPVSDTRLISPSSTDFTVDFTDKSSFMVSGIITYNNTNVPVEGVQFKIDGQYVLQSDGTVSQTNGNGEFNISVPVGIHKVQAVKSNHVFVKGGEILDVYGNELNYQSELASIPLFDSTTVRFIGRVSGGVIQAAYPLGHSLSKNNLGKSISISLNLTGQPKLLNTTGKNDTLTNKLLPFAGDSTKMHQSTTVYSKDSITIYPDAATGEFAADIIPAAFYVNDVTVTGWGNILANTDPAKPPFDFSDKFIVFKNVYSYQDTAHKIYYDTVTYNDSALFILRAQPAISITQLDINGNPQTYFGDSTYSVQFASGQSQTISVVDTSKRGADQYLLKHPVFSQNLSYTFNIKAFEAYPFYVNNNRDIATLSNGKPVIDIVPSQNGEVNINNEISDTRVFSLSLDSTGSGHYQFTGAGPNLNTGLEKFSASVTIGQDAPFPWVSYDGSQNMAVYNIAGQASGTDFVTQGPNNILMVLRDPPGSRSFTSAQTGTTITTSKTFSGSVDQESDNAATASFGPKIITWVGVGGGETTELESTLDASLTVKNEEHWTNSNSKTNTLTLTNSYQTSDDPAFVGANADVFIGYSTNITYGTSNNIVIVGKDSVTNDDIVLSDTSDPKNTYVVVKRSLLSVGNPFGTLFSFPQQLIENQIIPHLKSFINDELSKYPMDTDSTTAQFIADTSKHDVYISNISPTDARYGKPNGDPVFGNDAKKPYNDGDSYSIYYPKEEKYNNDTILTLNNFIKDWTQVLADNEKAKLNATLEQNYSFHAGSPVTHSEQTDITTDTAHGFSFIVSSSIGLAFGFHANNVGIKFNLNNGVGGSGSTMHDTTNTQSSTLSFTLAADGTDEYISVDEKKATDGGFVFITRGGETSCPYEGETRTKYYMAGSPLNTKTVQIEVPKINVDNTTAYNVPASRPAIYNLTLRNNSDAKLPATYILGYVDNDSIKGATLAVEGDPIDGSGRPIIVQYGDSVKKVLTLTKGTDFDYNNILIVFHSACQYDPTSYQQTIADTAHISAHFIPSCTDVHLTDPPDRWTINTVSPVDSTGARLLPVTIDKFDVNDSLFNHIDLEFKPSSSSEWTTVQSFYADSSKLKAGVGDRQLITNPAAINYNLLMDNKFPDQNYDVQAVSVCKKGSTGSPIITLSNTSSGIKDTYPPRLFGSAEPANGVLGISDAIKLNFNEPIAGGLLTMGDNFQVTGMRNGSQGDHSVSVQLDGQSDYLATEFSKNFTGKSITAEMWVKPGGGGGGTLFSQGNLNNSMELSITGDSLTVKVGAKTLGSKITISNQTWSHFAIVYNDVNKTVSAFYNFKPAIPESPVDSYKGTGPIEFGRSISRQGNFFAGNIHEARIWSAVKTSVDLQVNSLINLSGGENGLLAYYPMNEGKGTIAYDKAHGSNAKLTGNWTTPPGKAVTFNSNGYIQMNTSSAPIDSSMDYTIELWFKGAPGQTDAALASNGRGDGTDRGGSANVFFLGFENGLLTYINNGFKAQADGNYLDNNWHHVAVAVNRVSGTAQLFVDGDLKKYFDATNVGGIEASDTYLGVRAWHDSISINVIDYDRYFNGVIDEFRIWNTYMNQTLINKNNNVRLNGDELGLKVYYPFEKDTTSNGGPQLIPTLSDLAINVTDTTHYYAISSNTSFSDDKAPIKAPGAVSSLNFDFVVNNDALIIDLLEDKQAIDKTIVTFRVESVQDENGNKLVSPVTWTAYINQNPLTWSDDELNLSKEVYAPMQFESYIINSGGDFRISRLITYLHGSLQTFKAVRLTHRISRK